MDTHEVLVAARNRIARDGWQGRSDGTLGFNGRGPNGEVCSVLAASDAFHCSVLAASDAFHGRVLVMTLAESLDVWRAIKGALREAIGHDCIVEWNDTPGRTKEEVLAAFDAAIAATAPDPLKGVVLDIESVGVPA